MIIDFTFIQDLLAKKSRYGIIDVYAHSILFQCNHYKRISFVDEVVATIDIDLFFSWICVFREKRRVIVGNESFQYAPDERSVL